MYKNFNLHSYVPTLVEYLRMWGKEIYILMRWRWGDNTKQLSVRVGSRVLLFIWGGGKSFFGSDIK